MGVPATAHILKCDPDCFWDIWEGLKEFEIRKNDRGFKLWDYLKLLEYDPTSNEYSGSYILARVTYMIQGQYGLPPDICVMGLHIEGRKR